MRYPSKYVLVTDLDAKTDISTAPSSGGNSQQHNDFRLNGSQSCSGLSQTSQLQSPQFSKYHR